MHLSQPFKKSWNGKSKLTLAHVVDTRALQSVSSFDAEVYEGFQTEANELLDFPFQPPKQYLGRQLLLHA